MKIEELKGQDIVKAYDCNYLADDFGYSCANFNVEDDFERPDFDPMQGNDMKIFDIYIENPDNISCFVIYDNNNKIKGRRMFFKGPSLLNDEQFHVPAKLGEEIAYMYGYYGVRDKNYYRELSIHTFNSFKGNVIYTDSVVYVNKAKSDFLNYFIFQIEKANFELYPPTDFLYICTEIRAYSNFNPEENVMSVLEDDFSKENLNFYQAYRYDPKDKGIKNYKDYFTWGSNEESQTEEESQDEDEDEEYGI